MKPQSLYLLIITLGLMGSPINTYAQQQQNDLQAENAELRKEVTKNKELMKKYEKTMEEYKKQIEDLMKKVMKQEVTPPGVTIIPPTRVTSQSGAPVASGSKKGNQPPTAPTSEYFYVPQRDGSTYKLYSGPALAPVPSGTSASNNLFATPLQTYYNDPAMKEMNDDDRNFDRETKKLAFDLKNETDPIKEKQLRTKLIDSVKQHFEVRQNKRNFQLEKLKAELDKLESAINEREANKDSIIDKRTKQLLGEDVIDF